MADASQPNEAQAIARYEGYLRHDPDNVSLLIVLGDLYHRSGNFSAALRCYEKCAEREPQDAQAKGRMASVMISQHRFAEAEQLLRSLTEGEAPAPALLHNLGIALYCQMRWAEALEAFQRAHVQGLNDAQNVLYQAYALHHLGEMQQAAELCRSWLETNPNDAMNGYLAVLEMDKGEMVAAHQRAEEVLQKQPANADAALVEGMWQAEHQEIDRATELFGRVLKAEPDNPRGWLGQGLVHLYKEENAAAIEALENACKRMPQNVGSLVTLGWARFAHRDLAGAERTFRQAVALDHNFGEAQGGLAITLVFLKRYQEARRRTQIALKLNPQGFGGIYAQGALLALDGKRPEGEAKVAQALLRSVTADGRPIIEHIQVYLRKQMARAPGSQLNRR